MPRFPGVDYIHFDSLLTEQELLVRQTARQFVDERVVPIIRDAFNNATFPAGLIREMGELGFFGANLEGYGCAGMNNVEYGLIMQELERGDSGLRSFVSVQGALVMYPIYTYGSEEQKQRWLPRLQSGEAIGCFGLTEPDFGSNPVRHADDCSTSTGTDWILNGEKTWITNGSAADRRHRLGARTGGNPWISGREGHARYSATSDIHGKLSMRASVTSSLHLSGLRHSRENVLPGAKGLKSALRLPDAGALRHRMGRAGRGDGLLTKRRASYALSRKQFDDKPLAGSPACAGEACLDDHRNHQRPVTRLHVAKLKDGGKAGSGARFHAEANNVAMALECARLSRDLLGANGIMDEYPIMRHMCNLETVKTYEGTDHIHALVIGERVTGLPAYR